MVWLPCACGSSLGLHTWAAARVVVLLQKVRELSPTCVGFCPPVLSGGTLSGCPLFFLAFPDTFPSTPPPRQV